MALGALEREILWKILKGALGFATMGLGIGIPMALVGRALLSPLLYNAKANGVTTLVAAAGLLIIVSLLAAALPAFRASRLDPVVALRNE